MGCCRSYCAQLEAELQVEQPKPQRGPMIIRSTHWRRLTPIPQLSWGKNRIRVGYEHFARRNPPHSRGSVWGRLQGSTTGRGSTY